MLRPPRQRRFLAILAVALLAGCGGGKPPEKFPDFTWTHLPPLKLKVDKVAVTSEYQPRVISPHVETLTPRSLLSSAMRWPRERLVADGGDGVARYVVTDASVVEERMAPQASLASGAANERDRRYVAHVAVRLEIRDEHGAVVAQALGEATAIRTVPETVSDAQVAEAWYLVVERAMLDLNADLARNIPFYLSRFMAAD